MLTIYDILLGLFRFIAPALRKIFPQMDRSIFQPRDELLNRWKQKANLKDAIWFHVSSVGELEQVRPVIHSLRLKGHKIYLTYFSSSVVRVVKNWDFVDEADYLPLDFSDQMQALIPMLNPRCIVFNRYDLWPNFMLEAKKLRIPLIVVNASIPPKGWFGFLSLKVRKMLFYWVDGWTFVDTNAAQQWEPLVYPKVKGLVTGDPRVDRALERVDLAMKEAKASEKLNLWKRNSFCVVAGSTWPKDESLLLRAWRGIPGEKSLVIVPHEPDQHYLRGIEENLKKYSLTSIRWSQLTSPQAADVLLVDQRGFLAEIYAIADFAYVGGGFGRQIHSVVEPAAHGIPVAFGPHFQRSPEAFSLVASGGGKSVSDPSSLQHWWNQLRNLPGKRAHSEEAIRIFLQIHKGAGQRVAEFIDTGLRENQFHRTESWDRIDSSIERHW